MKHLVTATDWLFAHLLKACVSLFGLPMGRPWRIQARTEIERAFHLYPDELATHADYTRAPTGTVLALPGREIPLVKLANGNWRNIDTGEDATTEEILTHSPGPGLVCTWGCGWSA